MTRSPQQTGDIRAASCGDSFLIDLALDSPHTGSHPQSIQLDDKDEDDSLSVTAPTLAPRAASTDPPTPPAPGLMCYPRAGRDFLPPVHEVPSLASLELTLYNLKALQRTAPVSADAIDPWIESNDRHFRWVQLGFNNMPPPRLGAGAGTSDDRGFHGAQVEEVDVKGDARGMEVVSRRKSVSDLKGVSVAENVSVTEDASDVFDVATGDTS